MASDEPQNTDIAGLSFEQALSQLEKIVAQLEAGNASLEESIDIYTRGTSLKLHCESKLKDAQTKIEKITLSDKGAPVGTVPLDAE
jgi:exodeoxyribonuclease VII small subunit